MMKHTAAALLGLACLMAALAPTTAVSSACVGVAAAATDSSASGVEVFKSGSVVNSLCPGVTYGITLTFPEARAYEVVSTKGAFTGGATNCPNRLSGSASGAAPIKVTHKLYLGCAATGAVKLSVLSKSQAQTAMVLKTVSKPIMALSSCPASPCTTSPAPPATNTTGSPPASSNGATVINLTGNPAVDMMTMWNLFSSGAASTNATNLFTSMLPKFDADTILTVIAGMGSLDATALKATTTLSTIQGLLSMVPASADSNGVVAGMQKFLGVMSAYLPSTDTGASATQQMSASAVTAMSSMATMFAGTVTGNQATSMRGMLSFVNSVGDLMSLAQTAAISVPGVVSGGATAPSGASTTTSGSTTSGSTTSGSTTTTPAAGTTDTTGTTTPSTTTTTTTTGATDTGSSSTTSTSTTDPASAGTATGDSSTTPATTTTSDPNASGTTTTTTTTTTTAGGR